jgi:hypothetical protein
MKTVIEKYLVETNLWVAFCFTALVAFFQLSFYQLNFLVLGIAFFGTISIYNFARINDFHHLLNFNHAEKARTVFIYSGLVCTLLCVIFRAFDRTAFVYLAGLGLLSMCYSFPFFEMELRAVPFLKLFLIAFVWAGSSIGLLLVVHHEFFRYKLLFLSIMLYVTGITIPFDIRDVLTDRKELKTIPQLITMKNAKLLAAAFLILSFVLFYLEFRRWTIPVILWGFSLTLTVILVLNSNSHKNNFFFAFWIESCSAFPLIFYCLNVYVKSIGF